MRTETERVQLTVSCHDADDIPKVANAGSIVATADGTAQVMHNGVLVVEGCYYGDWMTEIIRTLRGHHEPQEERVFHEIVERVARVKKAADFATPVPLQAAVAAFLRANGDRKLRQARSEEVSLRASAAKQALREHLPEVSWWGGAGANPLFWLHLPDGVSGRRVTEAAAARGVGVAAGEDFDPRGEDRSNVRLSVSRVERKDIERGIAALAQAVRDVQTRSRAALAAPVV